MTRITRGLYLCTICKQPKKGHTCPGAPPVQIEAVFKKAFQDSRQSLKAKFASHDRLVKVLPSTQDMRTGAAPEVQVDDDAIERECEVEAAFGGMDEAQRERQVDEAFRRMQEHDQMHQQLCPMDAEEQHELVADATGGLLQFVPSGEDADAHSTAAVASGPGPASLISDDCTGAWWHEIVW